MKSILAFAIALLLAGCAAPGVQTSGGQVTLDQKPVAGEGHVLLRVQAARPSSFLNPKWRQVNLRHIGLGRVTEVYDISAPTAGASLFFARLPAGEYEIQELFSAGPGPGLLLALMMSDQQSLGSRIGSFKVTTGAVANLGTLVVAQEKGGKGLKAELLRDALGRDTAREDVQLRTGQPLTLQETAAWSREEATSEAESARARARAMVSVLSAGDDALGAEVIGGTPLGQILIRERGKWRSEPLPTLAVLTYARRLADGALLAGADGGRYFVRRPGGSWQSHRLPERDALVVLVEPVAGQGLLVVANTGKEMLAYRAGAAGIEGAPVARFETGGALSPVLATADTVTLVRNSPAFSRESWFTIIDKQSLKSSERHEKFLVFGFQRARGGPIVMNRYSGLSHFASFSTDEGRSWRHSPVEAPLGPYFIDAQRGYALDFNRGMFTVDSFLVKTVDGGKTWTRTGAANAVQVAGRVLGVGPDGEVIATLGWEVLSSRDEGKTWQQEIPAPD
jgi:hypothetical protein